MLWIQVRNSTANLIGVVCTVTLEWLDDTLCLLAADLSHYHSVDCSVFSWPHPAHRRPLWNVCLRETALAGLSSDVTLTIMTNDVIPFTFKNIKVKGRNVTRFKIAFEACKLILFKTH